MVECGTIQNETSHVEITSSDQNMIQINVDEYLQEVALKEEERKKPISTPLERFYKSLWLVQFQPSKINSS